MTEDYKSTLLKYLTGNLNIESGDNSPQYSDNTVTESTIGYFLESNAGNGYEIIDILQGYQSNYSFIYGNTANNKGFIVIIDENYNPVQYIDSYSTGTSFGTFKLLNIADDGNVYGVDVNNSTPRFIMLNNITLLMPSQTNFVVKLRQSYNLPSPLSTASNYFAITKAVGQAKYLFGYTVKTQANYYNARATQLTINVGAQNDWVHYDTNGDTASNFYGCSMWASWDGDTINFRLDGYLIANSDPYYSRWSLFQGRLVGSSSILSIDGFANDHWSINTVAVNQYLSYIGIYDGGANGESELIKIISYSTRGEFTYSDVIATYQKGVNATISGITDRVQFKVLNGVAYFMTKNYERYSSTNNLYLYIGMAVASIKNIYGYLVETGDVYDTYGVVAGDTEKYKFYISNLFNLFNYNVIGLDYSSSLVGGTNILIQQIYNPSNYNGLAYENVNSLLPYSGVLYDSNGMMIFARNLYNKTLFRNTTVSTIEIPNTMINNITIAPQNLIGATNKILNSNTESFTKNNYETVYLNYYNTLLIQDRNTIDYTTNLPASESLNNSVSLNNDYNDKQATKCKVTYNDNSNYIFNIQPTITGNQNTVTGGNILNITSNIGENPLSYTVDGVCEQDGTPTPSSPIEVKTIPSVINYFDKANTNWYRSNNGDFVNTTNTSTTRIRTKSFAIEGGKTYVVSGIPNGITLYRVRTFNEYGGATVDSLIPSNNSFTLDSSVKYIHLLFDGTGFTDETNTLMANTDIMLEEGTTVHEYMPYGYYCKVKIQNEDYSQENKVLIDMSKTNLFDDDNPNIINANFNAGSINTLTSNNNARTIYIPCEPDTTYILTKSLGARFFVGYTKTTPAIGVEVFGRVGANNSRQWVITTSNDATHLVALVYNTSVDTGLTQDEVLATINIFEGHDPTPYYEICKVGDYKDILSIDENGNCVLTKNITKRVFTGGENWSYNSSSNMPFRYTIPEDIVKTTTNDDLPMVISDYYGTYTFNNSSNQNYAMTLARNSNVLCIRNIDISTLANFKTWLGSNNTTIYYALNTPETITLENTQIPLFEGTNYVIIEGVNTNTSITYKMQKKAIYDIRIYVPADKLINSIDIISQDETVTYQTIPNLNVLENSKYYQITQDCYIE